MSVENELNEVLRSYRGNVKVYPFSVPDDDNSPEAIAYKRIGNRVATKYHSMNKQLEETLFFVTRVCDRYEVLTDDQGFYSLLRKYNGGNILGITIENFDDYKDPLGFYERQYQIVVLHKRTI